MKVQQTGPFFSHDPGLTFRANVRVFMRAVAAEGAQRARGRFAAGQADRRPLSIGGRSADRIEGRTASISGRDWRVTAVVSVNTAGLSTRDAIATLAGAAMVERETHAFRRVTSEMRAARAANTAELLKGIQ